MRQPSGLQSKGKRKRHRGEADTATNTSTCYGFIPTVTAAFGKFADYEV
jgi:hypothetical protein